jgi:hypothetical protein
MPAAPLCRTRAGPVPTAYRGPRPRAEAAPAPGPFAFAFAFAFALSCVPATSFPLSAVSGLSAFREPRAEAEGEERGGPAPYNTIQARPGPWAGVGRLFWAKEAMQVLETSGLCLQPRPGSCASASPAATGTSQYTDAFAWGGVGLCLQLHLGQTSPHQRHHSGAGVLYDLHNRGCGVNYSRNGNRPQAPSRRQMRHVRTGQL